MKTRLRKLLTGIHFIALPLAILNSILKSLTTYSLEGSIEFIVEMTVIISGLLLFFFYLRPFRIINFYYSIYAFAAGVLILALLFRGFFWGMIAVIIFYPVIPDEKEYEQEGIIISVPFRGFMAPCCSYQIKERKLLIFEKDYGILELKGEGPIDISTIKIKQTENEIEITFKTDFDKVIKEKKIKK